MDNNNNKERVKQQIIFDNNNDIAQIDQPQQQPRRKRTKPCCVDRISPPSPKDNNNNKITTSAGPTILIAPEDYVHIYKGKTDDMNNKNMEIPKNIGTIDSEIHDSSKNITKTNQQQQQQIDNTPTILIAPKDYVHIYKQAKS